MLEKEKWIRAPGTRELFDTCRVFMDMGFKTARTETVEEEEYADTAIEIGKYTLSGEAAILWIAASMSPSGNKKEGSGNSIVIYNQEKNSKYRTAGRKAN